MRSPAVHGRDTCSPCICHAIGLLCGHDGCSCCLHRCVFHVQCNLASSRTCSSANMSPVDRLTQSTCAHAERRGALCRWTYEAPGWDHIAALAPVVIARAAAGDASARSILESGADEIADSAAAVLGKVTSVNVRKESHSTKEGNDAAQPPIVLCGGLLADPRNAIYSEALCSRLRARFPQHMLVTPHVDAEYGAALLACDAAQRPNT